jgi:hypothetical protein
MEVLSDNSMIQESTKNAKKMISTIEKRDSDDAVRDDILKKDAYARLATNYIRLQQHDSTVWAYKKVIEIDLKKPKTIHPSNKQYNALNKGFNAILVLKHTTLFNL